MLSSLVRWSWGLATLGSGTYFPKNQTAACRERLCQVFSVCTLFSWILLSQPSDGGIAGSAASTVGCKSESDSSPGLAQILKTLRNNENDALHIDSYKLRCYCNLVVLVCVCMDEYVCLHSVVSTWQYM